MSTRRGHLRRVHIDGDEWKWSAHGQRSDIKVYSPYGKRYTVRLEDFLVASGHCKDRYCADDCIDGIRYRLTPAAIKTYIERNFVGK